MHTEFYILNLANFYYILFNKCIYMHTNFNYTYTNLENIPVYYRIIYTMPYKLV